MGKPRKLPPPEILEGGGIWTDELRAIYESRLDSVPRLTQRQRTEARNMFNRAKSHLQKTFSTRPDETLEELQWNDRQERRRGDTNNIYRMAIQARNRKRNILDKFERDLGTYFTNLPVHTFPAEPLQTVIAMEPVVSGMRMTDINRERALGNLYGTQEIDTWLERNPTSPTTRQPITTRENYMAHIEGDPLPTVPLGDPGFKTYPKRGMLGKLVHYMRGRPEPVYEDEIPETTISQTNPLFAARPPDGSGKRCRKCGLPKY